MYRSVLVDTLVTHTNIEGFGLTPLSGDHHGYMPPLLKTKQTFMRPTLYCFVHSSNLNFLNYFSLPGQPLWQTKLTNVKKRRIIFCPLCTSLCLPHYQHHSKTRPVQKKSSKTFPFFSFVKLKGQKDSNPRRILQR